MENVAQFHNETKLLLEKAKNRSESFIQSFHDIEVLFYSREREFGDVMKHWKVYEPTYRLIEEAQEKAYRRAIQESLTDAQSLKTLRDFFLSPFGKLSPRYDLIAALGDSESAQIVFTAVEKELNREVDDDVDSSCFNGLFELFRFSEYKENVLNLIRSGFNRTIEAAGDNLVNDTIFNHIGRLCIQLNDEPSAGEIYKAFVFGGDPERHYEMNTVAAKLSLYLTALNYQGPIDAIRDYIDYYNESYGDDEFVVMARYSYWWFKKEVEEALLFLGDSEKKKSLGIVASLLADLNEKKAIAILQTRLKDLTNPVTCEVFKEAIHRLETQNEIPKNQDRMIWMFGFITRTELALGNRNDNVFVRRAEELSNSIQAIVQEVDDSTPEDI
ncbi:hypothetical protein [Leptospira stimsonii]|uniref:hypothetical protein n=1 Tax=Leptospira stimsonii TaxID=2202203 RepID=UPI001F4DD673|nr:hypothetical protein [Leptospira stimsonii]